ncbi:MAG: hypothetical protein V3U18_06845 [Alphaproteobacteria bacterium]|jgi:hypothetical protein
MKKALFAAGLAAIALGLSGTLGFSGPASAEPLKFQYLRAALGIPHPPVLAREVVALKVVEQGYTGLDRIRLADGFYIVDAYKAEDDRVILFVDALTGVVIHEGS